jgi:hypothetical protein
MAAVEISSMRQQTDDDWMLDAACKGLTHLFGGHDTMAQPVGDVLAADAQRGAVFHQADAVDVGTLEQPTPWSTQRTT